jgi:hypothetical protein
MGRADGQPGNRAEPFFSFFTFYFSIFNFLVIISNKKPVMLLRSDHI